MENNQSPKVGLSFIDILFAIVVGIGLERAIGRPWFSDLLHNVWDRSLWIFILSNSVVIGSWLGYHIMMTEEKLDQELKTKQGLLRFLVDVVLLFLYCRLVVAIDSPVGVFRMIWLVFFFYLAWDCIVITEKRVEKRSGITLMWVVIFGALYYAVKLASKYASLSWPPACVAAMLFAFVYRYQAREQTFLDPIARRLADLLERCFGRLRRGKSMRIYIAGPYTAATKAEIIANVDRAIDTAIALYKKGHRPFIPHLTHYIDERAAQLGIRITREEYVRDWDKPWLEACDALVLLAESPGAKEESEAARDLGKRIYVGDANAVPDASNA